MADVLPSTQDGVMQDCPKRREWRMKKTPKRRPFLTNANKSVATARSSTLKQTKDPSKRRK